MFLFCASFSQHPYIHDVLSRPTFLQSIDDVSGHSHQSAVSWGSGHSHQSLGKKKAWINHAFDNLPMDFGHVDIEPAFGGHACVAAPIAAHNCG